MKAKKFDCVQMKHLGAAQVQERTAPQTKEQELAFWHEPDRRLLVLSPAGRPTRSRSSQTATKGDLPMTTSIAFSPDGETIVSASHDNTLMLWDARTCVAWITVVDRPRLDQALIPEDDQRRFHAVSEPMAAEAAGAEWQDDEPMFSRIGGDEADDEIAEPASDQTPGLQDAPTGDEGSDAVERPPSAEAAPSLSALPDRVDFPVVSPPAVSPGDSFLVDVWAHLPKERAAVMELARQAFAGKPMATKEKGGVRIARGSALVVTLVMEGFDIDEPCDAIFWDGSRANADFDVVVPPDAALGRRTGKVVVSVEGLRLARRGFMIEVAAAGEQPPQAVLGSGHASAFASYAGNDRDLVMARV